MTWTLFFVVLVFVLAVGSGFNVGGKYNLLAFSVACLFLALFAGSFPWGK